MSDSTAAPAIAMPGGGRSLPAQRFGADGRAVIDYRAITALALPLMVNSSLQAVISLTDTWFVGHISTTAMAGMAAIFWLVFFFVMLLGGVGLAVQTFVAQAEGSRRRWRASHSTWVALWGAVLTLPLFAGLAWLGGPLLDPFGLDPQGAAPRARVLGSAHARRADRRDAVGRARVLQRHFAPADHGHDDGAGRRRQRGAEPGLHLRAGLGYRRGRVGDQRQHAVRRGVRNRRLPAARPAARLQDAHHLATRCREPVARVQARPADGRHVRGRPVRHGAVLADAGAARPGRRRHDADRRDADVHRLHARRRPRAGGHDAGRPGDRRR